jgi:hypothetical protein
MNLKDFVRSSLVQIVEGVQAAIEETKDSERGRINPSPTHKHHGDTSPVEFDVAVTVTDTVGAGGKAAIAVVGFKIGGGADSVYQHQSVSRLKFAVPVAWPSIAADQRDRFRPRPPTGIFNP